MQLIEGEIVWTCAPAIECGYDERLHLPHQVKLRVGNHNVWYGHSFCEETGEMDRDSNATIFAKEHNCFKTKQEANDCYAENLRYEIRVLQEELQDFEYHRNDDETRSD